MKLTKIFNSKIKSTIKIPIMMNNRIRNNKKLKKIHNRIKNSWRMMAGI